MELFGFDTQGQLLALHPQSLSIAAPLLWIYTFQIILDGICLKSICTLKVEYHSKTTFNGNPNFSFGFQMFLFGEKIQLKDISTLLVTTTQSINPD
jgi:hypothetical protein